MTRSNVGRIDAHEPVWHVLFVARCCGSSSRAPFGPVNPPVLKSAGASTQLPRSVGSMTRSTVGRIDAHEPVWHILFVACCCGSSSRAPFRPVNTSGNSPPSPVPAWPTNRAFRGYAKTLNIQRRTLNAE
ncbi:MAG TPA: hypothetical protein VG754_10685 [Verrucomicrobiae bacterium]|nr:hypothetical protein [Verrucomicrobiae bacterium]